ncbi:GNAT family N-acetyltransferase [Catenulispora pinisilvae]|uniref:GNAT family N-acetyltransferase n=1 Tax=Catenulispora pinisilvae TaxID=2705253 RepID=UPI0018922888|nr:GNAT family N-acetyltransferase [Catenulispora pinisilvae]
MIRAAAPADVPTILALVAALAEYEREPQAARATEEQLHAALFAEHPAVFALIAEDDAGTPVGFALYFLNFSTWNGTHGIYLEDLFVRPEARGGGHGSALLRELARIAVERGYSRVEWSVLKWNEPSIGFYKALGAVPLDEWTMMRLTGDALQAFGSEAAG